MLTLEGFMFITAEKLFGNNHHTSILEIYIIVPDDMIVMLNELSTKAVSNMSLIKAFLCKTQMKIPNSKQPKCKLHTELQSRHRMVIHKADT